MRIILVRLFKIRDSRGLESMRPETMAKKMMKAAKMIVKLLVRKSLALFLMTLRARVTTIVAPMRSWQHRMRIQCNSRMPSSKRILTKIWC